MEVSIRKKNKESKGWEVELLQIKKYNVIKETTSLLFVREEIISEGETQLEVFKVLFVAACKTIFENEILVAFFLDKETGTGGVLNGYIISNNLPDGYDNFTNCCLLEYEEYCNVCNLTKEETLSFLDYYKEMRIGNYSINSLKI